MQNLINALALAMVPAVVWMALVAVKAYWPRKNLCRTSWTAGDLLSFGVSVSYLLTAVGNGSFWAFHFLCGYMGWDEWERQSYELGQLANIFTRNMAYIAGSALYLAAAHMKQMEGVKSPRHYLLKSAILTMISLVVLIYLGGE